MSDARQASSPRATGDAEDGGRYDDDGFEGDLFADLPTMTGPEAEGSGADPVGRPWGPLDPSAGVEDLLRQAVDLVASARRAPLSASVLLPRDDLLEVLQRALEALPDELRQARWLLRERQEFLAQRQREADELIETVRAQAERMVQRTEIVRQANHVAQRTVTEARDEARRLRREAEDFCDRKLAAFEVVLERTARTVRAGRERLATPSDAGGANGPAPSGAPSGAGNAGTPRPGDAASGEGVFDQDQP